MSDPYHERPPHFPPGTPIGDSYTVEGLVRLAEGRMFYLVNDNRPDQPNRRCWECDSESSPREATSCVTCDAPLRDRRFLMSARWNRDRFDAYESFHQRALVHPGLCPPVDMIRLNEQLLSFVPYNGEGLMIDEASPVSNHRVLDLAQRVAGVLAFLHINGVRLGHVTRANLLVSPDNSVRFFDPEVVEVLDTPVPEERRGHELASFAELLRRYCNVEAEELVQFFESYENGRYATPQTFGRAVEKRFDSFAHIFYDVVCGAMSDVGLTRQLNEDNWGWRKLSERSTLDVVDGMGGHEGGEVASNLAVRTICRIAQEREAGAPPTLEAMENLLDEAFQCANNTVKDEAEQKGTDMGTTLVSMLVIDERMAFIANVGDSRGYLLRDRSLHQLTRDHSLVAKMVERGRISAEEARHHPHSNILLRTVGTERDVEIDIIRVELEPGDRVLLCSDGLWGEVDDRDMEKVLNDYEDPRFATRELVRASHHGGGKDNVTLMIVQIPTRSTDDSAS
jgi:serine/threonine protein phosphatase PrpC/tRNA A-37 threonylcarbamoyl transferase component Bud32